MPKSNQKMDDPTDPENVVYSDLVTEARTAVKEGTVNDELVLRLAHDLNVCECDILKWRWELNTRVPYPKRPDA